MNPNALLIHPYDDMNLSDRLNAVKAARRAAWEDASADRGSAGGVDQPTIDFAGYLLRIVEPAEIAFEDGSAPATVAAHTNCAHARQVCTVLGADDPRVRAYCAAWAESMAEAAEELAALDAEIAAGVSQ